MHINSFLCQVLEEKHHPQSVQAGFLYLESHFWKCAAFFMLFFSLCLMMKLLIRREYVYPLWGWAEGGFRNAVEKVTLVESSGFVSDGKSHAQWNDALTDVQRSSAARMSFTWSLWRAAFSVYQLFHYLHLCHACLFYRPDLDQQASRSNQHHIRLQLDTY